nr:MAG TPA: Midasin biogenesis, AAA protein, Mechanochemical.7A [Caudoviricetes sp.]
MLKLINYDILLPNRKIEVYERKELKGKIALYNGLTKNIPPARINFIPKLRGIVEQTFQNYEIYEEAKYAYDSMPERAIINVQIGRNTKTIYVLYNKKILQQMIKTSWMKNGRMLDIIVNGAVIQTLAKYKLLEEFEAGVTEREFGIILNDQILTENYNNSTFKQVFDAVVNAKVLYYLEMNYQELAKFAYIFSSIYDEQIAVDGETFSQLNPTDNRFDNDANQLYCNIIEFIKKFCKYQIIDEELVNIKYSEDFQKIINEAFPFLIISKRCGIIDCYKVAALVLNLLKQNDKFDSLASQSSTEFVLNSMKMNPQNVPGYIKYNNEFFAKDMSNMSQFDIKVITRDMINMQVGQTKDAMQGMVNKVNDLMKGAKASLDKTNLPKKNGSTFFLQTIDKYKHQISEMEKMFKKVFTKVVPVNAFDGDINFKKQQLAYLSSKTNEDAKVYNYQKKELVDVDIIILRDISGSTEDVEVPYAESVIMFLSAVNRIPGIRTMQIDYNKSAKINKQFHESVDISCIYPVSNGGTDVESAYRVVLQQKLKGKLKLLFVISDGETFDKVAAKKLENVMENVGICIIKFAVNGATLDGYKSVNIKDLHNEITKEVLKRRMMINA